MVARSAIALALLPLLGLTTLAPQTLAQSITPASDGTGTMVQQEGNTYTIRGGTQVDSKVFHSFGELGLSPNEIANFLSNPNIQTIFGRVTGGNPSIIQGLLQVTGGNSNLLLMNPAGIVFTQGASFNIPGSLTVTTADAIGFESGFFTATGNVNYQNLVGAPNTFVFTGDNGSIVNAAELELNQGNLALIGSSVINTGTLSTASGTITITAVPENRTVRINQAGMVLGLEISPADLESGIQATDLARLLTGSNLEDDTGIRVDANDELRLTDTNHPLDTAGNVTIAGQVEGNQVHLAAANDVNPIGSPETLIRTHNGEYSAPTVTRFAANPTDANSYIFLDATVPDYSNLLFGGEVGTTTVVVTPNENGMETITEILTTPGLSLVDALHIVSEGSEGNFWLGNAFVDSNTIRQYQLQMATWNQGLNVGADILLYACFVALGSSGDALLNTLASYTGVDVAGSTNLTGFGGDWQLERSVGEIQATAPFEGNVLANYGDTLQVFTTTNGNDAGIGSLRQALLNANAADGDDQIRFVPGLTEVTLTSDELFIDARNGDLIIDGDSGGASNVIVERSTVSGTPDFRIFDITGDGNVTIDALTIRNGVSLAAGGITRGVGTGTLRLTDSTVSDNSGDGISASGIISKGAVLLENSTVSNNSGRGIRSVGTVTLTNSIVNNNSSDGISAEGAVTLTDSTVSGNSISFVTSYGIFSRDAVTLNNSSVSNNLAFGISAGRAVTLNNSSVSENSRDGISSNNSTVTLNNSTVRGNSDRGIISNGAVLLDNSTVSDNLGDGIRSTDAVTLTNSTVNNNSGDGISAQGAVTLNNSTVHDNSSDGIFNQEHAVTLNNSSVSNNLAFGIFAGRAVTLNNSTVSENSRDGILSIHSTVTLNNSTVRSNSGRGIISNGAVLLENSTVNDNLGGGIRSADTVTLTNSTVNGNSASALSDGLVGFGGGLFSSSGVTIINSTISGNIATGDGGGIYTGGGGTIINSTITNNTADSDANGIGDGGGIYNSTLLGGNTLTIRNSIVADNFDLGGRIHPDVSGGAIINGDANNLIGNPTGANGTIGTGSDLTFTSLGITDINQVLAPLANNGGSTQTHAPVPGSPALDAGNNANIPAGITTDQRGGIRIINDIVDIGAFESQGFTLNVTGSPQSTPINTAFADSLTVQVLENFANQPIPGVPITFNAPSSGASGSFGNGTTVLTNAQGIAENPVTANTIAGNYQVIATANGLSLTPFDLTNTDNQTQPPSTPQPEPQSPSTPQPINPVNPINDSSANPIINPVNPINESSPNSTINPVNLLQLPQNPPPIVQTQISDLKIDIVAEIEEYFTRQYEDYLGFSDTPTTNQAESQAILRRIEQETGTKPALLYAVFVPSNAPLLTPTPGLNLNKKLETPERERDSSQDQLELIIVTAEGQPIRRPIPGATREKVLQTTQQLRRAVTDIRIPRPYLPAAQQLYQWLVAPIEAELNTHQIDIISLLVDSGLRSLPMAILHDGEQFILEKYNVNLMPSISLTDTRYVDIKNLKVLAMGASEFTDQNPLPAVPVELSTITEKLWQGQSFLNTTFTPQQLKTVRNQTPFGILHLATHGEFKSGKPENSYIQFWNSKLSLEKIRELGLNNPPVELMVLSACRTALGDEKAELGFTGLAVQAGVKSALGSLWYVSDEATLGFMTTFYSYLKQAPIKAEALRQAQLAMIRGEVRIENGQLVTPNRTILLPPQLAELPDKELTHPYYWSAFTLVGNPW
ncbi:MULTISPECIES: CHAT domain-containing protein [unclassified Coleofasciculus]|uniref:CHAT domain-containing protein n=1 Tax=unclassified Coleofasciculus TaxID=2692782 RepID=UPI0018829EE4|nr:MULTISPECIES: CHAT domain-containing protein [unclassified Coleofasciculus]MBE9128270.1 CHAT domain-containing protein [Coleofasciculus sp. LEGE 07081]MBE9151317.1 CHAT domain-containing protein [Coleofasciculus sp. LEGE 07092]